MKPTLAASAVTLIALAHCARPAPPPEPVRLDPTSISLEAATVRRTDATASAEGSANTSAEGSSDAAPTSSAGGDFRTTVQAALDAQLGSFARCYEEVLATAPEATGRINVRIVVTPSSLVASAQATAEGEGGLAQLRPCVEAALRALQLSGAPAGGAVVTRSYSFVNPPIELTLSQPIEIRPPARRSTPAPQPSTEAARGVLTESEVSAQMALAVPATQACYATALRRAARLAGTGELSITLQPNGEVQSVAMTSSVDGIAAMSECVGAAVRAVRFRNSGTGASVRATLNFAR
jgi:hypothetical protein